jgi:cyclopropane-fatty-acyl-phospholipid synthase
MNAQDIFLQLLDQHIADARIAMIVEGETVTVGATNGSAAQNANGDANVTLRIHNRRFFNRVLAEGNLGMGESFMDRDFDVADGTLHEFLIILLRNRIDRKIRQDFKTTVKILAVRAINALRGKRENVRRHYDEVGDDLFELMLDKTMSYTCGYAHSPDDSLDELQFNKLDRVCRKLRLKPGDHLLDLGCGYGNLLIHAARHYGITGVGITNGQQHCDRGNQNIAEAELSDKVRIEFMDFRRMSGQYTKIVSLGMLEHLPRSEYKTFFGNIARAMLPHGLGLIHTVGCNAAKNVHDPFIQKYIFPGTNQARLSEIANGLEQHGLAVLDVENITRHYTSTLQHWLERFQKTKGGLDPKRYDDTFMRMWEYYLNCGIAASQASDGALWHVLFTNDYALPFPLQRV